MSRKKTSSLWEDKVWQEAEKKLNAAVVGVCWYYDPNPTENADGTWNFTVYSCDDEESLTFKQLDAVSEAFKTKEIDFTTRTEERGYCETCAYSWTALVLSFKNAKV